MIAQTEIDGLFLKQPEVAAWPAMQDVWQQYSGHSTSGHLPELACHAVGGDVRQVGHLVTAVNCCYISIVLVDDILDDDPKGLYHELGAGVAANLALAFQAVAYRIVQEQDLVETAASIPLSTGVSAMLAELVYLNLKTAQGQHLDVQHNLSEAHYWDTVEAKSTPYYGAGFYLGALAGGAETAVAQQLRHFGQLIGKLIQISDDLADAYQTPACPDWQRGGGNLAILYARLADHPEKARFEALLPQINDPEALEEAQQILLSSGAASYCVYQLLQVAQEARQALDVCELEKPELLQKFLAERISHLFELLEENKMPLPEELAAALLV